jgi:transitional endoplasmic reticulum ATPase
LIESRLRGGSLGQRDREIREPQPEQINNEVEWTPKTREKRANELTIEAGDADLDSSIALLHPTKMDELGFLEGDIIRLKGKRDREVLCIVQGSKKVSADSICVASMTRSNLLQSLGDTTKVYTCDNVPQASRALIVPFSDTMAGLSMEEVHEDVIVPYFQGKSGKAALYRPVVEGNHLSFKYGAQIIECKVIEIDPSKRSIIAPQTELELQDEPLDRAEEE